MSDLLNLYLKTTKARVKEARSIPALATDFFDTTDQFQDGFSTFEKKGDLTHFTLNALDQYNTERKEIVIPDSFVPIEEGVDLSRWTPVHPYYTTGQGK